MEVDGQKLENVRKQTYLGVILSEDGRMKCELEKRIGAALSTAGAVRSQVFESRELSRSANMLVYKAMIEPILMYGTESWVLKEKEKQRIQAAEMSVLRKIAGVRRMNRTFNRAKSAIAEWYVCKREQKNCATLHASLRIHLQQVPSRLAVH